jgi:hypothetical protein
MRVGWVVITLLLVIGTAGVAVDGASGGAAVSGVTVPLDPDTEQAQLEIAEELAETRDIEIPDAAYALTTSSGDQYVVLTSAEPQIAEVTVYGDIYPHPTVAGFILADSISGTRVGDPISLQELLENGSQYRNDLVRVQTPAARMSYTFDPTGNSFVYRPASYAVVGSEARLNWTHPGRAAREVVKNASDRSFTGTRRVLSSRDTYPLGLSTHKRVWWGMSQTTMNGIVISDSGTLAVGKTSVSGTTVTETSALHDRTGEIVSINATLRGASISTQETLLKAASCGEGLVVFPYTGCAPVPADVVIHSGVAYTGTPSRPSDTVFYVGLSNAIQTTPVATESGQYQLTGRVVSAKRLDPRLNGTAVFILDRERVGDVSGGAPSALPEVNTTTLLREQIVANRSTWAATHPDANTLGEFDEAALPNQTTPTVSPTNTPTTRNTLSQADTPTLTPTDRASTLPPSPSGTATSASSPFQPLRAPTEIFLGVGGLAVIMTLSGLILTASSVHHSMQETEPPFSTRGYIAVWAVAAASLSTALVFLDLKLAVVVVGLAVFATGWVVVLRRLFW